VESERAYSDGEVTTEDLREMVIKLTREVFVLRDRLGLDEEDYLPFGCYSANEDEEAEADLSPSWLPDDLA
jgi:hypothetical protein